MTNTFVLLEWEAEYSDKYISINKVHIPKSQNISDTAMTKTDPFNFNIAKKESKNIIDLHAETTNLSQSPACRLLQNKFQVSYFCRAEYYASVKLFGKYSEFLNKFRILSQKKCAQNTSYPNLYPS